VSLALAVALALAGGCQRSPQRCCWDAGPIHVSPEEAVPPTKLSPVAADPAPVADAVVSPREVLQAVQAAPQPAGNEPKPASPLQGPEAPPAVPALGHAADYGWLVGRLQYVHVRNAWRIRYAGPDEADRHGGSVTLVDPGPMTGYRSGQLVRVEGQILDPGSRDPSPAYQVHLIQPLSNP
jgi:hypothetical protein